MPNKSKYNLGFLIVGIVIAFVVFYTLSNLHSISSGVPLTSTSISSILKNPNQYINKTVTVKGELSEYATPSQNTSSYSGYGGYITDYQGDEILFQIQPITDNNERILYPNNNYTVTGIFTNDSGFEFINATSIIRLN